MNEIPINIPGKEFPVIITKTENVSDILFQRCRDLDSGCLCVFERSVEKAKELYNRVIDATKNGKIIIDKENVILFHSENTQANKKAILSTLLNKFGKDRKNRPDKAIIIGTSILEQSLDVDFDYIVTPLCPIDLIIQRMGRLMRHDDIGTIREYCVIKKPFEVVIPTDYDVIKYIYDEDVLKATENMLQEINSIHTVNDIRKLIDSVYNTIPDEKYLKSLMSAEQILRDNPAYDTPNNTDGNGDAYRRMTPVTVSTREVTYETISFAIVSKKELNDDSYKMAQYLHENSIINTQKWKLEKFCDYVEGKHYMSNVRMYVTDDGIVPGDGVIMYLTKTGIVYDKC